MECALGISSSPKRVTKLEAPPGSGKSLIYNTVSKILGVRTLILTAKKGLQDQLSEFTGSDLRGAANYSCPYHGTCEIPSQLEVVCDGVKRGECPRQAAIQAAKSSPLVVTNYHCWLSLNRYSDRNSKAPIGEFGLIVLDEAHIAPQILSDFCTIKLDLNEIVRYLKIDPKLIPVKSLSSEDWCRWGDSIVEIAREAYKKLEKGDTKAKVALTNIGKGLADLSLAHKARDYDYWLTQQGETPHHITLTPVPWPFRHAEELLFCRTPKIILSSAFLPPSIGERLGVKKGDMDGFEMDSIFDPKRRPFYYIPRAKVGRDMSEEEFRVLVLSIDLWIEAGRERRTGIIHCRSYDWGRRIWELSKYRHLMILDRTNEVTTNLVERHKLSPTPTILVSPAVEEGYDFKGEYARWQVVLRVPLMYAKDPITKARSAANPGYINEEAMQSIVQMVGRSTRSEDDWSETVLFDKHWGMWFRKSTKAPKFFRKSWRVSDTIPPAMKG